MRAGEWLRRAWLRQVARRTTVHIEPATPVEPLAEPPGSVKSCGRYSLWPPGIRGEARAVAAAPLRALGYDATE